MLKLATFALTNLTFFQILASETVEDITQSYNSRFMSCFYNSIKKFEPIVEGLGGNIEDTLDNAANEIPIEQHKGYTIGVYSKEHTAQQNARQIFYHVKQLPETTVKYSGKILKINNKHKVLKQATYDPTTHLTEFYLNISSFAMDYQSGYDSYGLVGYRFDEKRWTLNTKYS